MTSHYVIFSVVLISWLVRDKRCSAIL